MTKAENPQTEGIAIVIELIKQLRQVEGVKGIHIMPVGWEASLSDIVTGAGLLPRPILD
jgi:methylenetetrahydrofolate reductase (NADPH)